LNTSSFTRMPEMRVIYQCDGILTCILGRTVTAATTAAHSDEDDDEADLEDVNLDHIADPVAPSRGNYAGVPFIPANAMSRATSVASARSVASSAIPFLRAESGSAVSSASIPFIGRAQVRITPLSDSSALLVSTGVGARISTRAQKFTRQTKALIF
jgi:hypothetical protein